MLQWLLDILRGVVIGVSNIIPGVSGGTMAVSMGIYDRLINDITHLFRQFKKSLIDVLPIGIGVVIGLFAFSALIGSLLGVSVVWDAVPVTADTEFTAQRLTASDLLNANCRELNLTHGEETALLAWSEGNSWTVKYADGVQKTFTGSTLKFKRAQDHYQLELPPVQPPMTKLPTIFAFIGLILGGLSVIFRRVHIKEFKAGSWIVFVAFFALVVILPLLSIPVATTANLSFGGILIMCLLGMIASATMVIPGVSGSMVLMLLGYYESVIGALNSLRVGDLSSLAILAPFGVGVVLGLFLIAKIISALFEKAPIPTYAAILGLVLASPVALLIQNSECFSVATAVNWVISVVCLAAGMLVAWLLGKLDGKKAD